jgi:hypothetical protein
MCWALAKENNSGKKELIKLLFQVSSQKKQDEPSETMTEANFWLRGNGLLCLVRTNLKFEC